MESLTIEIINPKAKELLKALEELNLISISKKELKKDTEEIEWNSLSQEQQMGVFSAVESIKSGKGISSSEVLLRAKKMIDG